MKYVKYAIGLLAVITGLTACDKASSDGTKERARAEQEASRDVNNENLEQKANRMERELRRRYRFYKAVSHTYQGQFAIKQTTYAAKITFSPSFAVIESDRVRTLEEIQDDLNNLFLNAQIVIWNPSNDMGLMGCSFDTVRPDIVNGVVYLISNECPNSFTVQLTVPGTSNKEVADVSRRLSQAVLNGSQKNIKYFSIEANSKRNPARYKFIVRAE